MKRGESKFKKFFRRFWEIVWKDDSFKGWIISLVFIFVVIKLIFFPLLNLATGTSLPLAIVESCSMYHSGNIFGDFNNWWERHDSKYEDIGIRRAEFEEFSMKKGFSKGDIIFIIKAKPEKLEVGEVIVFNSNQKNPIIHRIVNIRQEKGEYIFSTMGDNNNGQLNSEINITEEQLVGKAVFKIIPAIGWAKLIFYEHSRLSSERGFCSEQ